jgi:hypothetical protein
MITPLRHTLFDVRAKFTEVETGELHLSVQSVPSQLYKPVS